LQYRERRRSLAREAGPLNRRLAVIVDDDPGVRGVLALLLEAEGWTVVEAQDGKVGLRLARRLAPDVIVTDLRMPRMSGMEMAESIRAASEGKRAPILAVTAAESDLRETAARSGLFVGVLTKPVRPEPFLSAVRGLAQERLPGERSV
jgi:CheY-like chemotaxis protein